MFFVELPFLRDTFKASVANPPVESAPPTISPMVGTRMDTSLSPFSIGANVMVELARQFVAALREFLLHLEQRDPRFQPLVAGSSHVSCHCSFLLSNVLFIS